MSKIEKYKRVFKEEAYEFLAELETSLLELEKKTDDIELVDRIFRALHTIKGSGKMCGFQSVSELAHEIETIYDLVRKGEFPVTKELIDLTLSSCDHIHRMLDLSKQDSDPIRQKQSALIAEIKQLLETKTRAPRTVPASAGEDPGADDRISETEVTYWIQFHPAKELFRNGTNPVSLLAGLRDLGQCRTVVYTDKIPTLKKIKPELCYTYWDIILTTKHGINAIKDNFIFVANDCELDIKEMTGYARESEFCAKDLERVRELQEVLGRQFISEDPPPAESPSSLNKPVEEMKNVRSRRPLSTIRVGADKLDYLVDRVGELVTVQARLTQTAQAGQDPHLVLIAEEVERLTGELRDCALSMRTLPIGTILSKFKRFVRDLSFDLGREVELTIDGEETELDKTVIEKLDDVLIHLIRNSIDHGIEAPEVREVAGKPRTGKIHLSVFHSGASVYIKLTDDGAGLDLDFMRAKAIEKGLIARDQELSEKELNALIFRPGFTTAKKVTDLSGRGVGLDVVKQSINALNGAIEIMSQKGEGTTITLKLPLTLAIIEGLLVSTAQDTYVMPLSIVNECVELKREEVEKSHGRRVANIRGELVPYIRLRETFFDDGQPPPIEQIVITEIEGRRVGFVVDYVIGGHQTVIKNMGRVFRDVEGISGATILGDGSVALILNAPKLAQMAELEEQILA